MTNLSQTGLLISDYILLKAEQVLALCRKKQFRLSVLESCTGGLLSATLTSIPGASEVFDAGIVAYSVQAKSTLTGVPRSYLDFHTPYSEEAVRSLAETLLFHNNTQVALAVTGIAGPHSPHPILPVGTCFIGSSRFFGTTRSCQLHLIGSRNEVRLQLVEQSLDILLTSLQEADLGSRLPIRPLDSVILT
jgi:nicotinamide-nucleotide amidase